MIALIRNLPLLVLLSGIGAVAMLIPAALGLSTGDYHSARVFFYTSIMALFLTGLTALATANYRPASAARSHLLALLGAFVIMPLMLAVPVMEIVPNMRFLNVYFEMVSSLTTTGATIFVNPDLVPDAVHLWRGLTGWMGGFLMWLMAIAILAPMNLGGFEVTSYRQAGHTTELRQINRIADPSERLVRFSRTLFPIYVSLTTALWIVLLLTDMEAFPAVMIAMATMSTSGILPTSGLGQVGFAAEAMVLLFLVFAISRQSFSFEMTRRGLARLSEDRELRFALALGILVPGGLFLRHWLGAIEFDDMEINAEALRSLWGSVFTVFSFLTTTGFESADWNQARYWSGLQTPGLILLGLALTGGGVATTAGGVKLMRVYALYKHGMREMEKLVHPSSVGGAGIAARHIRRQGAYIAWVFFMLFALSVAAVMTALALSGLSFETAMTLAVAALSTTGPIAQIAVEDPISYANLADSAKYVLMIAMIMGRLETLAIVALLNPDFWRN